MSTIAPMPDSGMKPPLRPFLLNTLQNFGELGRIVRDQAVHTLQNLATHVQWIVHRPRDYLQSLAMSAANQAARGQRPVREQRLGAQRQGAANGHQPAREVESQARLPAQF